MARCSVAAAACFLAARCCSACVPAVIAQGMHEMNITMGDRVRNFVLFVPGGVNLSVGLPAVVSFHGFSSNPYYYSKMMGTARYDFDHQFNKDDPDAVGSYEYLPFGYKWLFAYPAGSAASPSPLCCPAENTTEECRSGRLLDNNNPCSWGGDDDIAFAKALAAWLVSEMCADPGHLFASGFSNGAMFANSVGCDAADVFSAIAPFEGTLGGRTCTPARPISVLEFCGKDDGVCNSQIESTMANWGNASGCDTSGEPWPTYVSKTTHCQQWPRCANGTFVEWCLIDGMTHQMSGHIRPAYAAGVGWGDDQPATNVDGFRYAMNRLSTLLGDPIPSGPAPPPPTPPQPPTPPPAPATYVCESGHCVISADGVSKQICDTNCV